MDSKSPRDLDGSAPPSASSSGGTPVAALLSLQIVWGAMLASIAFYVGFGYFISTQMGPAPSPELLGTLELVFAATSLGCLAVSYLLPRKMFQQALGTDDPAALDTNQLVDKAFSPWIVRMALSESVAIFGLLLVVMSHQLSKMIPFVVLGGLSLLTALPSERSIRMAAGANS